MTEKFGKPIGFDQTTTKVIESAIRQSSLPEGVDVYSESVLIDSNVVPAKPFIVISVSGETVPGALTAYRKGALRYTSMDWNEKDLAKRLNS